MADRSPSKSDGDSNGVPVDGMDDRSLALHVATRLLGLGIVSVLGYLTRPLWHGFVYGVLYSPGLAVLGGGATVAALVLWFLPPFDVDESTTKSFGRVLRESESPIDVLFGLQGSSGRKLRLFVGVVFALAILSVLIKIRRENPRLQSWDESPTGSQTP